MKAAYKLHIGLDHDGLIPAFAAVTMGKTGDQIQAKFMQFQKGSVLVFDKGYSDYTWHNQLINKGIFWVTRIRGNAKYRVLERRNVNQSAGITSDQTIEYTSHRSKNNNLRLVRRIGFYDKQRSIMCSSRIISLGQQLRLLAFISSDGRLSYSLNGLNRI